MFSSSFLVLAMSKNHCLISVNVVCLKWSDLVFYAGVMCTGLAWYASIYLFLQHCINRNVSNSIDGWRL
jgi:hypothetical protein